MFKLPWHRLLPHALLSLFFLAASLASAGFARAHGDEAPATKPAASTKEQKAWGIAGDDRAARRRIDVKMSDAMRFTPARIEVRRGETVRLVIRNDGMQLHEFVIGTRQGNDEHAAMMARFPGMRHEEPYMAHVPPGQSAEIVWTFNRVGEFDFACLIAGHYQAGMRGTILVAAVGEPR